MSELITLKKRDSLSCEKCGKDDPFPFTCTYCKKSFCADHHLPENHECGSIWMARPPTEFPGASSQKRSYGSSSYDRGSSGSDRIFWFSRTELKHLAVGTLLVMLVALSLTGFFIPDNLVTLFLALISASSFLLHEIAHKFTAQRYGLWSEFRIIPFGAVLTIASIFLPLKIIAPGSVIITGRATLSTIGRTAFAGPLTNIILSYGLLISSFLSSGSFISVILGWGAYVNAILAIFNLIPFGLLDGQKIMSWNMKVWAIGIAFSAVLFFISRAF